MNRTLRRLAVVTTVFTYLLVAVGGLVRGTESGLGCPDWPRCHGRWIPPLQYHPIIEYSHRATASVVIWLTVALLVVALRNRRRLTPRAFTLAVIPLPIVLSQAILGAVVVHLDLKAESVVAHLLVAMTLVAVLISLVVEVEPAGSPLAPATSGAGAPDFSGVDRRFAGLASAVAGSALFLMLLGSYVSGRHAGLAFRTWPFFNGHVLPAVHGLLPDLNFAHRFVAAAVAVAIFALAGLVRRRPQAAPVTAMVRAAAALIGVEILLGAGNVWTRLSPVTRTAHLATAALIWGALFTAARLAWRLPAAQPSDRRATSGPGEGTLVVAR